MGASLATSQAQPSSTPAAQATDAPIMEPSQVELGSQVAEGVTSAADGGSQLSKL